MASHSCDHLLPPLFPLWTSCATQKDEFLTSCHHHKLHQATLVLQLEFLQDGQEISGWFVIRRSSFAPKKKKSQKFLFFIKSSQNDHRESALTEKTCKRECSCCRMLKFGFRNHKTLWHHRKQCFFFSAIKVVSCRVRSPVIFQTHLVFRRWG